MYYNVYVSLHNFRLVYLYSQTMPFKHITPVGTVACRIVYHIIFYSVFKQTIYSAEWSNNLSQNAGWISSRDHYPKAKTSKSWDVLSNYRSKYLTTSSKLPVPGTIHIIKNYVLACDYYVCDILRNTVIFTTGLNYFTPFHTF